jgi:hypothetical protein
MGVPKLYPWAMPLDAIENQPFASISRITSS